MISSVALWSAIGASIFGAARFIEQTFVHPFQNYDIIEDADDDNVVDDDDGEEQQQQQQIRRRGKSEDKIQVIPVSKSAPSTNGDTDYADKFAKTYQSTRIPCLPDYPNIARMLVMLLVYLTFPENLLVAQINNKLDHEPLPFLENKYFLGVCNDLGKLLGIVNGVRRKSRKFDLDQWTTIIGTFETDLRQLARFVPACYQRDFDQQQIILCQALSELTKFCELSLSTPDDSSSSSL